MNIYSQFKAKLLKKSTKYKHWTHPLETHPHIEYLFFVDE